MSEISLTARARRLETMVSFARDTWGLCQSHQDGLAMMLREAEAIRVESVHMQRLLDESPPSQVELELLEQLEPALPSTRPHPHARGET